MCTSQAYNRMNTYVRTHLNKIILLIKCQKALPFSVRTTSKHVVHEKHSRFVLVWLVSFESEMCSNEQCNSTSYLRVCILICRCYSHRKRLIKISCSLGSFGMVESGVCQSTSWISRGFSIYIRLSHLHNTSSTDMMNIVFIQMSAMNVPVQMYSILSLSCHQRGQRA